MKTELYDAYAVLAAEKKLIEAKMEIAKEQILADLKENNLAKYQNGDKGTFSLVSRKSYEYSKDIEKLEKTLKEEQKREIENGIAKVEESESLRFQA